MQTKADKGNIEHNEFTNNKTPVPAVSAIVQDGDKVLLIQRGTEPSKGKWTLPGGKHQFGETGEAAVLRELREETSIEGKNPTIWNLYEVIIKPSNSDVQSHYLVQIYLIEYFTGEAEAGSDAADVKWATLDELEYLDMTRDTAMLIRNAISKTKSSSLQPKYLT